LKQSIETGRVHSFIMDTLVDVVPQNAWGETSYFYNPGNRFPRGTYFATIKEKDGDNDRASALDGPGLWRLNFGVQRKTFVGLFGAPPARPGKGGVIEGPWNFSDCDVLTPHPIYGWMSWLAVKNPSVETFEFCKPLIVDAHMKAKATFEGRLKKV
jgi:hypothetical protein